MSLGQGGHGGRRGRAGKRGPSDRSRVSLYRHQSRILALQIIYEVDATDHGLDEVISRTLDDPDDVVPSEVRAYAERLARGVTDQVGPVDAYISAAAPAFPVPQLASVDRNVLRLAIYELLHEPEVPTKAAINEAVELAKRYGGLNSSRFVNGVLGTVFARIEQERAADSGASAHPEGETPPGRGQ